MALQPRIIACGNKVATFAMAVRFLTGPAVMAAASLAVGLRGTLLHVAIVQVNKTFTTDQDQPTAQLHKQTKAQAGRPATDKDRLLIEKKKKVHPNSGRVKWPAGMPIDMPPVPVKRGTAALSLLDFARTHNTNAG